MSFPPPLAFSDCLRSPPRSRRRPLHARPKLKITDVRTAEVLAHGYQLHVRIYTDQGLIGQGEGTDAVRGGVPLVGMFRQALMGQDPLNVDRGCSNGFAPTASSQARRPANTSRR